MKQTTVLLSSYLLTTLGLAFLPSQVFAQTSSLDKVQQLTNEGKGEIDDNPFAQVNAVSQLSDVKPTDWAFTALQSLVERYGCIAGYPDKTYRGNQALSRYEFAAGVNACMDKINEIIASGLADKVSKDDLAVVQKLQEEFAAELATLRGRVDTLEGKVATLEAQQFSPTTKLFGQVIFGAQGRSSTEFNLASRQPGAVNSIDSTNVTFGYSAQLSLITQLNPKSILLTSLQMGNISTGGLNTFTNSFTRLSYESTTGNSVILTDLTYRQQLGDNFAFIVGALGVNPVTVFRGPNRYESAAQGPISQFAQRNPILALGGTNAGIGFDWQIAPRVSMQGVYSVSNASVTSGSGGLFGDRVVGGVQFTFSPSDTLDSSVYYLINYNPVGFLFTGVGDDLVAPGQSILTQAIGGSLDWRIDPKITLGLWGGYTNSRALNNTFSGNVETINWMAYLNFPNLFNRGDLLGLYVGQPPKITSSTITQNGTPSSNLPSLVGLPGVAPGGFGGQPATTTHLELFYRYRLSNNISITPGIIFIFNPFNTSSQTITIGSLRTSFTF